MTDDEIKDRIRRLPELATGLLIPSPWFERVKRLGATVMTGRPVARFGGVRFTECPLLPPNVCVWIDDAGQIISLLRMDKPDSV